MIEIADRIEKLGTETAFAVAAEAKAHEARGNKIYSFHLGDINMRTPLNIIEAANQAMLDGKTGYCPNAGIPQLREALARNVGASHNLDLSMENVVVQPGGKPTIGKFVQTLMNPGEEVLYPNPGYPIYESQIEYHGGKAVPYGYLEGEENFQIDLKKIADSITGKTRILVLNDLQNPTAAECSREELEALADLAIKNDLIVLSDEAYFDLRYRGKTTSIASLPGMAERTVILYTFSKKYAMTGWRVGASIGPKEIVEVIARLNTNDESNTTHFLQWACVEALEGDQSGARRIVDVLKERRDCAVEILQSIEGLKCYKPDASFYLYPNVTEVMQRTGFNDYEKFRKTVLQETGVSFCNRLHFGRPLPGESEFFIRLAYSGIDREAIEEGLNRFKAFLER